MTGQGSKKSDDIHDFMPEIQVSRVGFNKRVDELIENMIRQNLVSKEYRAEYVKTANLLRQVAEYDARLAFELLFEMMMVAYYFSTGVIHEAFSKTGG